ncbi:MAG TPA: hypothetical protein VGT61_03795 [Thermomicrobiales bacterium]|jgi:hypothetical protein|nr:hypothetical protein [Thermomicrobiales bacterium]
MIRVAASLTLLLALAAGLFLSTPAQAQEDEPQCSDFDNYFDAWAVFEEAGGPEDDPYNFDPDGNGYPCDDLPEVPADAADAPDNAWPREAQDDEAADEASEEPIAETPEATEEASEEASTEPSAEESTESESSDGTGGTTTGADGMPVTGIGPIPGDHGTSIFALTLAAMVASVLAGFSLLRTRRI